MKLHTALVTGIAGLVAVACIDGPTTPDASLIRSSAASSAPVYVSGNPTCTESGFIAGVKQDPTVANGTYTLTVAGRGTITFTVNGDNTAIASWSSDFPIDAVFMKAGPGGLYYTYDGATTGGGEVTPDNKDISHIDFCWYGRFLVGVTGTTSYTRTHDWSISKSAAAPASVATGSAVSVAYSVAVTDAPVDSDFWIDGIVTVFNTGWATAGLLTGVSVNIAGVGNVAASCDVSYPYSLADNDGIVCTYGAPLPDATPRTVTATVTAAPPFTSSAGAYDITFGAPRLDIEATVTVSDSRTTLSPASVSAPTTWNYTLSFGPYTACVPVEIDNIASFTTNDTQASGNADASVTVNVTGCGSGDAEAIGTGFAYGDGASTFTTLSNGSIKRWGWSLQVAAPGSYTYDVYVGAGQNNLANGTKVGTVTITYDGSSVSASYALDAGFVVMEEHLYAGATALPNVCSGKKCGPSVAPGQMTVAGNLSGGSIWVIAHSVIGYVQD